MSSFSPSKFTSGSRSDRIALAISNEGTAAADERVMEEEEEEEEEEDKNDGFVFWDKEGRPIASPA